MSFLKPLVLSGLASAAVLRRDISTTNQLEDCPGYVASNVETTDSGLTAELTLAGSACNVYGDDLEDLLLSVTYETADRIHVKIQDAGNQVFQVPEYVLPRPDGNSAAEESNIRFEYTEEPFSFSILRKDSDEVLFDTSAASLIFESQYLRLRTSLPDDPYLYGLGEHTDNFRLNTTDYIRTLWNRDSYAIPTGTNLYGSHPIYLEQRESGSHAVFLLNSNGMDIMINNTEETGQYLEYNILGGVFDFYFLAGPSPAEVVRQYSEVIGTASMHPYWGLGFQQCRYGYQDIFEVAEVVYNYSQANIPLEVMWTDIDYMDGRAVFTNDPERFPIWKMRQLIDYLHDHQQKYTVMVDPAIKWEDSEIVQRGQDLDVFLRRDNGSEAVGVVWPGLTIYPDWFSEKIEEYWSREFEIFFDKDTGVEISGLWIDMNEPANFCQGNCDFPNAGGNPPTPPPVREVPRSLPGFPCAFQTPGSDCESDNTTSIASREVGPAKPTFADRSRLLHRCPSGDQSGLPGRDLLNPEYNIHHAGSPTGLGNISYTTVRTDVVHENGLVMYDTHNLYGASMGKYSNLAMQKIRPGLRPHIITRSSFPGDGKVVGRWLGDNSATWDQYRFSIHTNMIFAALYQFPMVGSDVCGFDSDTTEQLCARWASLGAFVPFYRSHNGLEWRGQEFYRWETVADSARKAIDIRYRLLDYMYTAMYDATETGSPSLNPMFYIYPQDKTTWDLAHQYFYGQGLLVAPVLEENATSVDVYLPEDTFYDWYTHEPICGTGASHTFTDQDWTDIPLLIRSGVIMPLRVESANTTTELRKKNFELIVPLTVEGTASGELYLDDGVSIEQDGITHITFNYEDDELTIDGTFDYPVDVRITKIKILRSTCGASTNSVSDDSQEVEVDLSLNEPASVKV